jgi:hypothetical protein
MFRDNMADLIAAASYLFDAGMENYRASRLPQA